MKSPDLTYRVTGAFVAFYPETREGRIAWEQLAAQTDGTGKVLRCHLPSLLAALKRVGIRVRKATASRASVEILAKELAL
jgi:hypothetical protein